MEGETPPEVMAQIEKSFDLIHLGEACAAFLWGAAMNAAHKDMDELAEQLFNASAAYAAKHDVLRLEDTE